MTAGCDTDISSVCPLTVSHGPLSVCANVSCKAGFPLLPFLRQRIHDSWNMHEMRHRCATELQLRFLNRATVTGAHRASNRVRGLSFVSERALLSPYGEAWMMECSISRYDFRCTPQPPCLLVINLFFSSRDRMRRSLFPAVVIIMWLDGTNVF